MENFSEKTYGDTGDPQGVKRKRSTEEPSSVPEEDTDFLKRLFKHDTTKSENKSGKPPRKRKFIYNTESVAAKKSKKFCYINKQMTKPHRPRVRHEEAEEPKEEGCLGKKHKLHFAKFDGSGNVVLKHRMQQKFDLFFNDEKKCNYEASKRLDLSFHIVDEIALEGLDGITLEAFWKRLKNVFPNNINKNMADRIWRLICGNKHINIYILKEPREELIFFDKCKYLDIDSGFFVEPFIEFKDIYPMASVNGTEVRGSCSTFDTRKENNGVRKFSVEKAIKLYDQRLVFVADQSLRNKALINEEADPNIELQDVEYCILEKIGRSRDQGEITQGKMSLASDNKRVYHNRKVLMKHSLIVLQNFCLKSLALQQTISGGIVHLSRFYNKRKTKQIVIMEKIASILRTRPNYQMELSEFKNIFGRNVTILKLVKTADFRKFFKIYTFPYRKLYPNATKNEYLSKNKQRERQVKVLRMLDPCANVSAIMDAKESKEVQLETSVSKGHKFFNCEYLRDIFLYILSAGQDGATIQEIHDYFNMDFYSVRMAVRKLLLRNVIDSNKIDLGRQQSLKFFAKCFATPGCHINTQPKNYELSDETLTSVLTPYKNIEEQNYSKPELSEPISIQTEFKLTFDPFCCTAFLTETVDPSSDELTIYDIVIKGRDKLLLIESNLFAHYISDWDDLLLKRDGFSKSVQLFQNGFGKVVYDYLASVRTNDDIEADNCIVFELGNVTPCTRIAKFQQRIIRVIRNVSSPHSDKCYVDLISKTYLFEAMFTESHRSNQCTEKLQSIFERLMVSEGKRKREVCVKSEPKIEVEISTNVVMEKFMGSNPQLEYCEEDDGIKIEIFASTKPEYFRFGMYPADDDNLTQRYLNRANLILKTVYQQRVVKDVRSLFKEIRKEEDEEGYDKKVCNKSIVSIISKLVAEGYIKIYKVVMSGKEMTRSVCFVCVQETSPDHMLIKTTIDQLKLKFCLGNIQSQKTIIIKKKNESPFNSNDVKESIVELRQLTSAKLIPNYKIDKTKGKSYGYTPKFERMRVLHEHLFYLIRELTECEVLTNRQVFDLCKNLKLKMSQEEITELPPVYKNEVSWKMFIPALPQNNFPKGWALACDIILRMPLSVFVKLYNISYDIPELTSYLNHPIKRHFLLKHLPMNLRNILLYKRKYSHSIYEVFCLLCYVGLLQLGPRSFKEKDQVFIYLNSKATLYDTSSSAPGYNQTEEKPYKEISFEFKTNNDVEIYWSEMLRICMNTQLGKRKVLDGQCVTIEECGAKPAMMETLKAKTFEGAVKNDTGVIPGDRRGAAGVDSSLWTFVKRNWVWTDKKKIKTIQSQVSGLKAEKLETLPRPIQYDLLTKGGERHVLKPVQRKPNVKSILVKRASKKKFVRKIVASRRKKVREYYDNIDMMIMKKNPLIRVEWDEKEDQLLRYCRAAAVFLCPEFKKQFIPYNVMRDVLHRVYPKSKNKTARAIQRRIYVLLTNDEAIKIMETNIENFLNSDTISKYFGQIHNRYKDDVKITDSQMYISFIYLMSYIFKHRKEVELLLLGYFATFDFFAKCNIFEFENILHDEGVTPPIYSDPKTVEDVTKDTVKSVIHCSMACKKNSVGWTFHLSRIYKKFPDELIRTAVASLKKHQFFVVNKNYEGKSLDNNWPVPLKFSHVYNLMKNATYTGEMFKQAFKTFMAKINDNDLEASNFIFCNEINTFWESICFIFEIPEMGIVLNPQIEDHSEVIDELAKRFRLYLTKIYDKKNAAKKNESPQEQKSDKEVDTEKVKSKVRNLIFRVPYLFEGDLEMCFKKMLDSDSDLEINNYIFLMILDLKKFAQSSSAIGDLKKFVKEIEDESVVDDQNKLLKSLSKVVFTIQTIYLQQVTSSESFEEVFNGIQWENQWETEHKNDKVLGTTVKYNKQYANGMEEYIKRAQDGDFPSLEEIKEGMMAEVENGESRKSPHITDLIIFLNEGRFPELDTDNETLERMKDHFVMQYPRLDQFIIEDLDEMKGNETTQKITDETKITRVLKATENLVKQPQLDQIVEYIKNLNGTEDDIKMVENLIDFIKSKKELGVLGTELKKRYINETKLNIAQLLSFLSEIGVVLRTGVASVIYVHFEYQSEWLTETFMLTPEEKEVFESTEKQEMKKLKTFIGEKLDSLEPRRVQLRPWSKLDGSINDELFHQWMCIILSRCIDLPNIPFLVLCEHFHYIKPVDIYFLLEVLQELGCVKIYLLSIENNVFSARSVVEEYESTCLDSFEEMFVKPTNVSGLCFGSFLDHLEIIGQ